MTIADDIAKIIAQEQAIAFASFDEAEAFALGSRMRERALADELPIIVDIRTWDRPLFYAAMPGSTASNADWARRKINVVKMFHKSTLRMFLEQGGSVQEIGARHGLSVSDYVLAGGAFPIRVEGAGVIGAIAISGLPQRQDHAVVVEVLCAHLGLDGHALALAAD
ncbi:MAG: heme-degrading domain-containing protein [Mesorhizobium sp.]|nr:heme-degrading domain-containing protein [Mesorhizobium sp.]